MKYICIWNLPAGTCNATVARSLETGGAPPKGVQIVGRWHGASAAAAALFDAAAAPPGALRAA